MRIALLASLALLTGMSPRSWKLTVDPLPLDPGGGARLLIVESTHEPMVHIGPSPSGSELLAPLGSPTWPGRATYLVSADQHVTSIRMERRCKACASCDVPEGAKIAVASFTTTPTWTVDVRSAEQKTLLVATQSIVHRVMVSTAHPVRMRIEASGIDVAPVVSQYRGEFHVEWPRLAQDATVTWTAIVTTEGVCADAACAPPADARAQLANIVVDRR